MHIPDGFVDVPTAVAAGAVSLGAVAYSLHKTGKDLGERTVPLLGVTAAFIFAAQMLNFPVLGGTSGHILGATLAAILVGPWAAVVVMTAVLAVQALAMADGGLTALGANVLNMGLVAVLVGYGLFCLLKRLLPRTHAGRMVASAVAAWASVAASAAACSLELAVSGTVPLGLALPSMVSVHMVIGLGEALVTTAVLAAVLAARPELVRGFDLPLRSPGDAAAPPSHVTSARARFWSFVAGAVVVAAALALFIAPFASGRPDGLARVAADKGFQSAAGRSVWDFSPFPHYQLPGLAAGKTGTALAGVAGTVLLFVLVVAAGRALGRRPKRPLGPRPGPLAAHDGPPDKA